MARRRENFMLGLAVAVVLSPVSYSLPSGPGYSVMIASSLFLSVFSFFVAPNLIRGIFMKGNSPFNSHKEGTRDAMMSRAQTFMLAKEYEKALKVYLQTIEKYPHDVVAYRSMLDILCGELGQYSRAEKEFRRALRKVEDKRVLQKLLAVYNDVASKKEVAISTPR